MLNDYYTTIVNLIEKSINDITDDKYIDFFSGDKYLLKDSLAITYFLLSKDFYIDKNKKDITANRLKSRLKDQDWDKIILSQLSSFSYKPDSISGMELVDRIRDSILHCTGDIDFNKRIIKIDNSKPGRELQATIPLDFFTEYVELDLYEGVYLNSYNFLYCCANPEQCILDDTIDNTNIEDKLKSLLNFFELSFKSDKDFSISEVKKKVINMLESENILGLLNTEGLLKSEDYRSFADMVLSDFHPLLDNEPTIIERYSNGTFSPRFIFNLATIKYYLKKKYDVDFSFSYINVDKEQIISELSSVDDFSYNVTDFLYKTNCIVSDDRVPFIYMKLLLDSFKYYDHEKNDKNVINCLDIVCDDSLSIEDKVDKIEKRSGDYIDYHIIINSFTSNIKKIKNSKSNVIAALLYTCFVNCYCVNKDKIDSLSDDDIVIPIGMKAYSSKKYYEELDKKVAIENMIINKGEILKTQVNVYKNLQNKGIPLENQQKVLRNITGIANEIANGRKENANLKINDPNAVVSMKDKKLVLIDDKKMTLTIIRNCFSHPGKVMLTTNEDGTVELFDYSDNNELVGYIHTDIDSLFEFLKQPSYKKVISENNNKTI